MQRRQFIQSAAAGTGVVFLTGISLRGQNAPSNKLNLALVGVWGRGVAHYDVLRSENVVALCDVNENRLKEALKVFPNAKTYWDWRRMLDQKDIDGVIICTADHHHAFISNWALNRGMHVFCEKPLGISVDEVRTVRANYLRQRAKLATQHGTQRHAYPNFERIRELILDGAIGELVSASCWDSRQLPRPGYPSAEGQPPAFLQYEQWIGPSPYHPYSPQYFGGGSGSNCLFWNMYRDFGIGQMGDMGAHTMDLVWNAIDAGGPTAIEVDQEVSDAYDPNITPVRLKVAFEHPKNEWRGPVTVVWYQGGLKPDAPRNYLDVQRIGNGAIFEGTKGSILCDFTSRIILPNNEDGDMTYYRRRSASELLPLVGGPRRPAPQAASRGPAQAARGGQQGGGGGRGGQMDPQGFPIIQFDAAGVPRALSDPNPQADAAAEAIRAGTPPRLDPFQQEWIDACKGLNNNLVAGTSTKTNCDFDYSGTMMEQMLLGLVAHQAGKRLEYDPATGRVTNAPEANDYLRREYRRGWTLNG